MHHRSVWYTPWQHPCPLTSAVPHWMTRDASLLSETCEVLGAKPPRPGGPLFFLRRWNEESQGEEPSQESPTYKGPDSRQVRQVASSGNSVRDRGGVAIAPQGCTTIQQRQGKRSCGGARQDSTCCKPGGHGLSRPWANSSLWLLPTGSRRTGPPPTIGRRLQLPTRPVSRGPGTQRAQGYVRCFKR